MTNDPNFPTGANGLVVVDNRLNRVVFLDPATLATIAVVDGFATAVHELAITPDRRRALCAVYGDGYHGANPNPGHVIAVVDLATRAHVGDFDLRPHRGSHGLRWGKAGTLWALCETSGVALELDGATGAHRRTIEVGSFNAHRMEVLPDGSKLYTENEEDATVSILDLERGRLVKLLDTPNALAGIGMSPDGRQILLVDDAEPRLLLLDPRLDEITGTLPLDGHRVGAQIAKYSPDGRWCVVTSLSAPLATILSGDLGEQRLVEVGSGPMNMAFHPDGDTVVIANGGDGTLSVVDLPTATVTRTVRIGGAPETLSFY